MAGVKISGLPASAVPLAGTEILPIVKSGVTDQVTVANLTAGRAVSAASIVATGSVSANSVVATTSVSANSVVVTTSVSAASLSLTAPLPIASGGTNSAATPTAGGAGYGTGTAHAYTAAGTVGQVLTSQGASAPTWATAGGGAQDFIVQSYGII